MNSEDMVGKWFNVFISGNFYNAKVLKVFMAEKERDMVCIEPPKLSECCKKYLVELENGLQNYVTALYNESKCICK